MPKLLLLDGHSLAYRAFFALPPDLATKSGTVTNAVYGFTSMLAKVLADENLSLADQLETRKLVDRAKGKLMDLHGMSEGDAFGFMRKTAMDTRSTLKAVAGDVIDGTLKP